MGFDLNLLHYQYIWDNFVKSIDISCSENCLCMYPTYFSLEFSLFTNLYDERKLKWSYSIVMQIFKFYLTFVREKTVKKMWWLVWDIPQVTSVLDFRWEEKDSIRLCIPSNSHRIFSESDSMDIMCALVLSFKYYINYYMDSITIIFLTNHLVLWGWRYEERKWVRM